ncbi:uncharacterized protein LOC123723158 [Papilio machaon]|uniref:uncharacterized protein LOC123723158 n=1 Tax=Papilio machaon TaxID=76193 RepID=UPI001E662D80|nr:uncharacterized protein LOC123723158 [Papilio machaon]
MHCSLCKSVVSDCVKCGWCNKELCFGCASITEAGYRKLGADRRAAWRCPQCRSPASASSAPALAASPPNTNIGVASIEVVLSEIRDLKAQFKFIHSLADDVKTIKKDIADLKLSLEFNHEKITSCESRITVVERSVAELVPLRVALESAQLEISNLKTELTNKEQWSRLNNIEIKGVPLKKDENLFSLIELIQQKIGFSFNKSQINYIARVPSFSGSAKSIIVTFVNRYVKEEFAAAARANKDLYAKDIGFEGDKQRIFINDHLTPHHKALLTKTKRLCFEKGYKYVWVKYCKIHVRKNDTSPVFTILKDNDLNKII